MFNHILVPLDGSELAECVLPHVMAIAPVTGARITLIHVLERASYRNGNTPIDPVGWHMQKQELQTYLERKVEILQKKDLHVEHVIVEGNPAEDIIDFARNNAVDLIALSTHGQTGLSGWNVSSVVQKILLRAYKSILLVRAFAETLTEVNYQRLFIATDGSTRAEFILPFAMSLAQYHQSNVILGTVIQKPQILQRFPLPDEENEWIQRIMEKNQRDATHYLEQLATQLSLKELTVDTNIVSTDNTISALYDLIESARADLVMLTAHGQSGERRWPYGSITASLIAYGSTPLMIMQDLADGEVTQTHAERAIREGKGR